MKVFLSWSGERSQVVAKALHGWLPRVIQAVSTWLSSSDIEVGTRWANELALQLEESQVGIICLTPENLSAPWLLYEAGALSKALESTFVCPFLIGFSPAELTGPFVQFQATTATYDGTRALVRTLNRALGKNALDESILEEAFEMWWPSLAVTLQQITGPDATGESDSDIDVVHLDVSSTDVFNDLQQIIRQFSSASEETENPLGTLSERVFIVHGHDEAIKEAVARFVERLGLAAIILHEQPNEGKTIIEKFESNARVDYAVVLLTGDDAATTRASFMAPPSPSPRARQNVVFELGFFTARLGRSRVCVLYEDGVEIPSDFSGILYIPIDAAGAWRFLLAQELKTAGLKIDLNKAFA